MVIQDDGVLPKTKTMTRAQYKKIIGAHAANARVSFRTSKIMGGFDNR